MSGSKTQMDKVEDVIKRKKMPLGTKTYYKRIAKERENKSVYELLYFLTFCSSSMQRKEN